MTSVLTCVHNDRIDRVDPAWIPAGLLGPEGKYPSRLGIRNIMYIQHWMSTVRIMFAEGDRHLLREVYCNQVSSLECDTLA